MSGRWRRLCLALVYYFSFLLIIFYVTIRNDRVGNVRTAEPQNLTLGHRSYKVHKDFFFFFFIEILLCNMIKSSTQALNIKINVQTSKIPHYHYKTLRVPVPLLVYHLP